MINLDAIRRKVAQLNGEKFQSAVKIWKPKLGEYRIRVLPWKDAPEGVPFKERYVYYGIGKSWMVSPESFGMFDPIREFTKKLWDGGKEEDKNLAKKLFPRLQTCAAIIDRNAEDEGPQLWVMNKNVAKDVTSLFLNAEVEDFTDLGAAGTDIIVNVTQSAKKFNDKPMFDVKITPSRKSTVASNDPAKIEKWMSSLPNVDEYFKPMTSEQVKAQFDAWINSGGAAQMMSTAAVETSRDTAKTVESTVDELESELKAVDEKAKVKETPTKSTKKDSKKEHNNVIDALDEALNGLEDLE